MIIHLLLHHLRHHRLIYLLAAVLVFGAQLLPYRLLEYAGGPTWVILGLLGIASVVARLLMRDHPWHSHTAFWRTRPITPRMLFVSQMLALGLAVLLPFAAGLLLHVLPLSLGPLPTALAILVPLAAAVAAASTLAACASLATGNRGRDMLPYFAAFVVPMLSFAACGFLHLFLTSRQDPPPPGDAQILSQFLCGLALINVAAPVTLMLATLGRRWGQAVTTLLVAGLALPWVIAGARVNFFHASSLPKREIGTEIPALEPDSTRRPPPRWTGLEENEFFAPLVIYASWIKDGRNHPWMWPSQQSPGPRFAPRLNSDLLQNRSHRSVLENQHQQFSAAVDIPAIWESIRRRLPDHTTWRPAEAPAHIYDPLDLGAGPDMPRFSLHADGDIYRLEALTPLSPVTRGRIDSAQPGRLEIQRIACDDSQIAILLRQTIPNPSLFDLPQRSRYYSTAPPEFWAVLLHPPTSTVYACHGMRLRSSFSMTGSVIETRHHLLSFKLPRLETRLLGLDPQQLLAESELHLFHAVPMALGEVYLNANSTHGSDPASRKHPNPVEDDESGP